MYEEGSIGFLSNRESVPEPWDLKPLPLSKRGLRFLKDRQVIEEYWHQLVCRQMARETLREMEKLRMKALAPNSFDADSGFESGPLSEFDSGDSAEAIGKGEGVGRIESMRNSPSEFIECMIRALNFPEESCNQFKTILEYLEADPESFRTSGFYMQKAMGEMEQSPFVKAADDSTISWGSGDPFADIAAGIHALRLKKGFSRKELQEQKEYLNHLDCLGKSLVEGCARARDSMQEDEGRPKGGFVVAVDYGECPPTGSLSLYNTVTGDTTYVGEVADLTFEDDEQMVHNIAQGIDPNDGRIVFRDPDGNLTYSPISPARPGVGDRSNAGSASFTTASDHTEADSEWVYCTPQTLEYTFNTQFSPGDIEIQYQPQEQIQEESVSQNQYYLHYVVIFDPETFEVYHGYFPARSGQAALVNAFREWGLEGSVDDYDYQTKECFPVRDLRSTVDE